MLSVFRRIIVLITLAPSILEAKSMLPETAKESFNDAYILIAKFFILFIIATVIGSVIAAKISNNFQKKRIISFLILITIFFVGYKFVLF